MANEAQPFDNRTPLTEGQIRAATIGELKPLSGPIRVVDYDPRWPELFAREADRVRAALGKDALRIEYVGSTSVPGLVAKPIIDMLLVVADSADETAYVPALEAAGYVLRIREPEWYEHRMFKGPDADINLHVLSRRCPEIARILMFRDRLRGDHADRDRHAHQAGPGHAEKSGNMSNYADAKTGVVEEILRAGLHEGKCIA